MKAMKALTARGAVARTLLAIMMAVLVALSGMTLAGANPPADDAPTCGIGTGGIIIIHFELGDPDSDDEGDETDCDAAVRVDLFINALESYRDENGSFVVEGGGAHGGGTGWAFWESPGLYPVSIASVLIADGHLSADLIPDPYASGDTSGVGDVLVYRCQDRVGVFTITDGEGLETSPDDSAWWADNGCARYPIDHAGATYFRVSDPVASNSDHAAFAVDTFVEALESYADENGSFVVEGGGANGGGTGWAFWESPGLYPVSIASVLIGDGHLSADLIPDPYASGDTSGVGDVLVYRCQDRVGVFTIMDGQGLETSPDDSAWWADNGCARYPIDHAGATYFRVSEQLP